MEGTHDREGGDHMIYADHSLARRPESVFQAWATNPARGQ
jgi:hypothetical protein